MPPTEQTHSDLAAIAVEAAVECAEFVRASSLARETAVLATKTSPTDIVTATDIEAEELIRRRLAARCPGSTIVGEELADEAGDNGVTWFVDPIDGTVNYHFGVPVVAVSIAAAIDNTVVAGAVTDVDRQETFSAALGQGARLNGIPFQHIAVDDLRHALVLTGFSYTADRRGPEGQIVARLLPQISDLRCFGSAAIHLCWVAAGRAHAKYEAELHRYDYAAGALIAKEAGATVELPNEKSSMVIAASPNIYWPLRSVVTANSQR